jgi:predicted TIM-barrel fold metal-dependent hydrolase
VRQVVVIESSPDPEDNQRLLDLAGRHAAIVGVVGRLPVGEEDCGRLLDRFAANRLFRGIRLRSDAILAGLDAAAYTRDLERLAERGLAVDVIGPTQLAAADRLATRIPQLRVMLEHMGGARIDGDEPDPRWHDGIATASRHAHTWVKVSHVIQSADRDAAHPGLDRYAPWLEAVWKTFGETRVMFGTDWPVSLRHATYGRIHELVRQFVNGRSPEAARQFFADNARRAYGLLDD